MAAISVWIKSETSGTIETIGDQDQQSVCDHAIAGAPGVVGLSDSSLAEFVGAIQGFDIDPVATAQSLGNKLGLLDICVVNECDIDSLDGELPTSGEMPFWQDTKHIRPVEAVIISVRRCIELLESCNVDLEEIVGRIAKGRNVTVPAIREELIVELMLLEHHLSWVAQSREHAVVSMLFEI